MVRGSRHLIPPRLIWHAVFQSLQQLHHAPLSAACKEMSPEALRKAYDWIDVREDLLSRVASLDPKVDSNDKNIRPMYSHLLLALRRATITLIRIIAGGKDVEDGEFPAADDRRGCFMWKGINYLAKIWYVHTGDQIQGTIHVDHVWTTSSYCALFNSGVSWT